MLTAVLLFLFVILIGGVIGYFGLDQKAAKLNVRLKLWIRKLLTFGVLVIVWSIFVAVVLTKYLPDEQVKTMILLGRMIDKYFEPERIKSSSKPESTEKSQWELYQECVDRGVRYYTEIGSFPVLRYWPNTGRSAVNVARESCQNSLHAYGRPD